MQDVLAEFLGSVFIKASYFKIGEGTDVYGTGANGKSVLYSTLFGEENISSYPLDIITGCSLNGAKLY